MKKQDLVIVALLMLLMLAWPSIMRRINPPPPPAPAGTTTNTGVAGGTNQVGVSMGPAGTNASQTVRQGTLPSAPTGPSGVAPGQPEAPVVGPTILPKAGLEAANHFQLKNNIVNLTFSTYGASLIDAELLEYPAENRPGSAPKHLAFTNRPALAMPGLQGAGPQDAFEVKRIDDRQVVLTAPLGELQVERTLILGDGYELSVTDRFKNPSDQAWTVPAHDLLLSEFVKETEGMYGASTGIDVSLLEGGVVHLNKMPLIPFLGGSEFNKMFKRAQRGSRDAITSIDQKFPGSPTWLAVKNKFFCQLLTIKGTGSFPNAKGLYVRTSKGGKKNMEFSRVSSGLYYDGTNDNGAQTVVAPGTELVRDMSFFVGAKKFSELDKLGGEQGRVMEFGKMTFLCNPMLRFLNWIYGFVGNYGIAIILLTVIIRMAFWPLLRKSTKSMKQFSVLGPQMKEIREKHKGNNQKIQEETMKLYKEHGVSPLAPMKGCLPALSQIPVFFALFYVLRSAVELRFSKFAWIADLSEPENLFLDVLPFGVNILPITMAISALFLQRMTPMGNIDPTQKKVMMFMPLMFLVFLYRFPSGLCLYYTTSNLIAIFQQWINLKDKKKDEAKEALVAAAAGEDAAETPAEPRPEFKLKVKKRKKRKN